MVLIILAPVIGLLGAALIAFGAWQIYEPAGFITAGALCLFWSWAVSQYLSIPRKTSGGGDD
ncbi:hypothetical protein [Pantoea sp. At-9b]|uniref:hypothetical protein n=1 Tax=Pantoea sp. (strain At-9b) TaxID=592316 RepID=UPI0001B3E519|nr:hypothetical protein [Pantoea sp. At-9b]ADU71546.1 conserved hypothetical protein [Pantoea sp. At-9b]